MHAIGTLIDKDGYRSIGAGVGDKPGHGLHDERVAHDYADAFRIAVYSGLGEYRAVIEPHELHQTDPAYALINNVLHFLERRCGGDLCREFDHVWPADRLFHRRQNGVKRLPGDYAAPLYVHLMSLHFRIRPLLWWVASGPVVQICAKPPSTNSSVPVM